MSLAKRANKDQDHYFELVRQFPLRPFRDDAELDEAIRTVDSLLSKRSHTRAEEDYLEVLGDLVERYESEAHPMPPVSDAAMLRQLMDAKGISQTATSEATGIAVSTISEVLRGKRTLNRTHIGKLANFFKVSPDVFAF